MLQGQLDNGFRYAVKSYGNAVGYCALTIRVGTRDEDGFHSGIAHFLEHTLFKGTSAKSSAVINSTLERLGGELNAFTTKEEIVLHATVLRKDLSKAAALLMEIAMDARFPQEEIEIEKGVVLDEIASYKDYPAEEIYDCFEEKLFAGHPLSSPILGTEESVKEITSDELQRFRNRYFTPDRMVLTMVSPMAEKDMAATAARLASKWLPLAEAQPYQRPALCEASSAETFNLTEHKDNNQVNCVMGAIAPSMYQEEERLATILLCNMLGGPASNSILGSDLREKHGWVYSVECNYTPYSDRGVAAISFGCDKENLARCMRAVHRELRKLQSAPLSERRLAAAKRQLLGQNAIGMENGEAQCISMGKSIISFGTVPDDATVTEKIMSVSAGMVYELSQRLFGKEALSTLIFE